MCENKVFQDTLKARSTTSLSGALPRIHRFARTRAHGFARWAVAAPFLPPGKPAGVDVLGVAGLVVEALAGPAH